jgi:hypothetical protein
MQKKTYFRWTSLCSTVLLAAALLVGCGGGEEATPTPTKTPVGGAQEQAATPTPAQPATGEQAAQPTPAAEQPPAAEAQPTAAPVVERVATVNTDLLNIRSEPSTAGNIVDTGETGETFTVLDESDDGLWLQLAQDGAALGWASAEYLTIEERVAATAPAPAAPGEATATPPAAAAGSFLPATMSSPDFGSQAFLWWRPEVAENDLTLLRNGGFNWVKQTFAWETIEGAGRGQFDWSIADRVVQQVNNKGLKLLARLSIDPDKTEFWAGPPPQNAAAFAEYAGALAARYNCQPGAAGCIQAFQIWNEPNLAREWGGRRPNPAEYAEFLRQAYAAIKAGNPNAIVINAGMAPTGDNNDNAMPDDIFYDQLYQAMGGSSDGYFDALGVHGAGYAAPPELDPAEAAASQQYGGYRFFSFRHVEDIRAIMEKYGDTGKQIVLLEFGWTSDPVNAAYKWHGADAGITESVKADYLKRAYQYAAANWPWVGLMSLITMPNADWLNDGNEQDEEQYWWAIMEPSPFAETRWREAYMVLCIYFNELRGQQCQYAPKS